VKRFSFGFSFGHDHDALIAVSLHHMPVAPLSTAIQHHSQQVFVMNQSSTAEMC
jgi:hypothetical protein